MVKNIFWLFTIIIILVATLRGVAGNPNPANWDKLSAPEKPFELSPERGRFALTYSLVEDKSLFFSVPVARFAIPDLGYKDGQYVSLFAPGISFLIIPGYLIGKIVGFSQVGAFGVIALFAVINAYLIRLISRRLGASEVVSLIASLVFIFATPAFAYGVSLYQHHVSTFLILVSFYLLMRFKGWWVFAILWFSLGLAVLIDYPNLILMLPLVAYRFRPKILLTASAAIIPLILFAIFSMKSYGNPLQLSGTVASVKQIDAFGQPQAVESDQQNKSVFRFFNTRNMLNGLYIHLISRDRGIIFFAPVTLLGVVGLYFLAKTKPKEAATLLAIAVATLTLYSLWSDPWGGWAFGDRYLIPAFAMLSIFLAIALEKQKHNIIFLLLFLFLFLYSMGVNLTGALTSNTNPPQVEAQALEVATKKTVKYSFDRNVETVSDGRLGSFVYQTWAQKYFSTWQYFAVLFALLSLTQIIFVSILWRQTKDG